MHLVKDALKQKVGSMEGDEKGQGIHLPSVILTVELIGATHDIGLSLQEDYFLKLNCKNNQQLRIWLFKSHKEAEKTKTLILLVLFFSSCKGHTF